MGDLGDRVLAFYDAWEFYAAAAPSRTVFTKAELKRLRDELPDSLPRWLDARQRDRITELVNLANSRPLRNRMAESAVVDGTPISEEEWAVLDRLREARNHFAHGRDASELALDDLEWGCSILSRALVYRIAREGGTLA